jgi:hypothetical protein
LSSQAHESFRNYDLIVAGVLIRSLLETSAAFAGDVIRLEAAWSSCRGQGPTLASPVPPGFSEIRKLTAELIGGGKQFKSDDLTPISERKNVQTSIDGLYKKNIADVRVEYDWLCSIAHPSLGEAFTFAGPGEARRGQLLSQFGRRPLEAFEDDDHVDTTVRSHIDQAAVTSLNAFVEFLDRAIRLIDDIALTTNAPRLGDSLTGDNSPQPRETGDVRAVQAENRRTGIIPGVGHTRSRRRGTFAPTSIAVRTRFPF